MGVLSRGRSSYESETLTLSSNVSGRKYLLWVADTTGRVRESNETNNVAFRAINILPKDSQPDLTIDNLSVPSSGSAGSRFSLSYKINNLGKNTAGFNYTRFYLSKDKTFGTDDTYIGLDYVRSLGAGSSRTESFSTTLRRTLAAGDYYLIAKADDTNRVKESDETNNITVTSSTIKITGAQPDLRVTSQYAPSSAYGGSSISVRSWVRNDGSGTAGSSTLKYYLSDDTKFDANDTLLGSDAVGSLSARRSSYFSETLKLGDNVSGQKYILFVADADKEVDESNEDNNVASRAINIVAPADLTIDNLSVLSSGSAGSRFSLSYKINNLGKNTAGFNYTRFYLSKDKTFGTDDTYIGLDYVRSLGAGSSRTESFSTTLRRTLAAGDYYLIAKADDTNRVKESDETNNITVTSSTIKITGAQPDLRVTSQYAPSSAYGGSSISVRSWVRNDGSGTAGSSTLKYYLSDDTKFDANDTLLGSDAVGSLSARRSSYFSETLKLGDNVSGQKYILFVADADGKVAESNETNNVAFRAINISGSNGGNNYSSIYSDFHNR